MVYEHILINLPSPRTVFVSAPAKQLSSPLSEVTTESVHRFALSEIEDATDRFGRRIGYGGFGIVYYGKLADGREIAVKLLINDSYQGTREFLNEVCFWSSSGFAILECTTYISYYKTL
mgnify:CR=1 FL=1